MVFYADRVMETTTTAGAGALTLGGAVGGFRGFVAAGAGGKIVDFVTWDAERFEVATGVVTAGVVDTLSRATVHASSAGGSAVDWPANGVRNVMLVFRATTIAEVVAHIARSDNPHGVTPAQIGAQPVDALLSAIAALVTAADRLIYATGVDLVATTPLTPFARTLLDDASAGVARNTLGAQEASANLSAFAGLSGVADRVPYFTAAATLALATFTGFGRSLVDDADASSALTTLGFSAYAKTLIDDVDAAAARTTLDAQQANALLTAIAGLSMVADRMIYGTGAGTVGLATLTSFARTLLDDTSSAVAKATLSAADRETVATVATDAAFTLTVGTSAPAQRHTGTLTADRTVTLSTSGAYDGATFEVTRTGGGAFNLSLGGLKNLATNSWARVRYDGTAWYLAAYGTL